LNIPGYRYQIVGDDFPADDGQLIRSSRLHFVEKVDPQAVSDMMQDQATNGNVSRTAVEEAYEFIYHYLTDANVGGEAPAPDILRAALASGISRNAVNRAADQYKIDKRLSGRGAAKLWSLPSGAPAPK
jgi:hypothetical protein